MDRMHKARIALTIDHPFFGSIALRMKLEVDQTTPTAFTDGLQLGYNPGFTESLTMEEATGLIAHEVMHVVLCHHLRRGGRDHGKWNVAGDFAINDILRESGFVLPEGALCGMGTEKSAEKIYNELPDDEMEDKKTGGSGNTKECPEKIDCAGEVRDYPGKNEKEATPAEKSLAEQEVKIMVTQAATQAKAMGDFPSALERLVAEITHPRVDWREVLRRFMGRVSKDDYAWFPPNRRYVHLGLYLPSLAATCIMDGVVAVDTSGSVSDAEVAQFSSEISEILESVDTRVTVLYCDKAVRHVETFSREDLPVTIHPVGGGGTDFRPVFDWLEENRIDPAYLIYLTDLECSRFPEPPPYPVLWARIGNGNRIPPFGDVVAIDG